MNSTRLGIPARSIILTTGAMAMAGIQAIAASKPARSKCARATRAACRPLMMNLLAPRTSSPRPEMDFAGQRTTRTPLAVVNSSVEDVRAAYQSRCRTSTECPAATSASASSVVRYTWPGVVGYCIVTIRRRTGRGPSDFFPDHTAHIVRVTEDDPRDFLRDIRNRIIVRNSGAALLSRKHLERLKHALR